MISPSVSTRMCSSLKNMSQTSYSALVAAKPIRALIIQPNHTYEVREVEQDLDTFRSLVGGHSQAVSTGHCLFWRDEEGELKEYPANMAATYLWWKLNPEMEGRDDLQGPVLVTGPTDEEGDTTPVPDEVIELLQRILVIMGESGKAEGPQ